MKLNTLEKVILTFLIIVICIGMVYGVISNYIENTKYNWCVVYNNGVPVYDGPMISYSCDDGYWTVATPDEVEIKTTTLELKTLQR